jgi:hypothetical protein
MKVSALIAAIAVLVGCGGNAADQGPIGLEKIGTIKGPEADGGFEGLPIPSPALRNGERIVIIRDVARVPPPLRVDAGGNVIAPLAEVGEGPGQVLAPQAVLRGLGDTLIVIDRGRIHLFDPEFRYVRSVPSPFAGGVWDAAQLPSGDLVLTSASGGARRFLVVCSLVDGSVKWELPLADPTKGWIEGLRHVAVGADSTLWLARVNGRPGFSQYSPDGALLRTVEPSLDWFTPYEVPARIDGQHEPSAHIMGFWLDSLGRAWIIGQASDPDWRAAKGTMRRGEGGIDYFVPDDRNDIRDGVIQVVDLADGRGIAQWRRDSIFGLSTEPGVMLEWRTDEDGWSQVDLYRVILNF